ncbi:hypothetical protein Ahy_A05g022832 isoform A [Arachis hypogaea]|uniref:Pentatricopeptide repeat-containing protein n=1 Tax=Arachis hypogaea TaxID=3818 RepID=A0A445D216_ARAHY|nr:hypothetical protein Ahy_A05g022832 isoform A [Arachis hypogaea]
MPLDLDMIRVQFEILLLKSVPHSALPLCFLSTSSLHCHSQSQSLDEAYLPTTLTYMQICTKLRIYCSSYTNLLLADEPNETCLNKWKYAEDSSESLWTCICDTNDFPKVAVGGCSSSYFNPATASRVVGGAFRLDIDKISREPLELGWDAVVMMPQRLREAEHDKDRKWSVWCDGEYVIVRFKRASLLAAAGDGEERSVAGHGVREGVDATGNNTDEADLGAMQKSAASGGGDNVRTELDGVKSREERETPYAPDEQNQVGKEIGESAENCSNSTAEKNIPPSVVNKIHASLDESGKQHVGICLMRSDAVQDSDLEDENTVVQETGLISLSLSQVEALFNSTHSLLRYSTWLQEKNVVIVLFLTNQIKIFRMGFQPDAVTLTTILKGLCLCGNVEKALHFHATVLAYGFHFDQVTYGTLINGLCKTGYTSAAIQVLRKIPRYGIAPDVVMYSAIIDSLCKVALVSDAFHLYSEMLAKGISPNVITYNTLIYGLCLAGQLKEAVLLLNDMILININPDVYTYSTLIDGLCKEGKIKDAKNVLGLMTKHGVKPNVVTYNSLMDGHCLVNEINKAKFVFNTMAQSRVSLNVRSYSIMINGLCKSKMVDEALNLFEEMRRKYLVPNTVTYNTLIDGLSKSKRISCALELLVEMHERGQPINVVTYNSLLDGMFNIKQVDKAFMLFEQMKESGIDPDIYTYSILIDGLCKSGRLQNAKEIFQDLFIKGYRPNVRTYTIMINGLCKEGLLHEALALMTKMEDNGCLPDAVTYETIIRALFENGENDKAEKFLREMISRGLLQG